MYIIFQDHALTFARDDVDHLLHVDMLREFMCNAMIPIEHSCLIQVQCLSVKSNNDICIKNLFYS